MGTLGFFLVQDFFENFLFGFKSHVRFSSWCASWRDGAARVADLGWVKGI
jgi:hypothetical protein